VTHPTNGLDDTVHQRVRLGILTVLAESKRADFGYLRGALELTDGNLSRHLQVLGEAGYVKLDKTIEGNRPRTWVSATKEGRTALATEIASLRRLLETIGAGSRG
jgi:DNA-binding MarR family transcriptional regulator